MSERCANTEALSRYLDNQAKEEVYYEECLEELREAEPEEYDDIIDSYGYSSYDLHDIIKDI